ncbi:MAG: hypothetical protein RRY33_08110 [Alistipes sp.]
MDKLIKEAQTIQDFLEITSSDDPAELSLRLSEINVYMARSGKMLADAKLLQDNAIASVYAQHFKAIQKMPATVVIKFVNSQCAGANYLVNWLDRINRTCVHQGDNIRTQVSFAKEDMSLTRKGY